MSKLLQLRGGTTAEHASFTGAVREVTVDTTKDTLVVHDGTTAGGHALSTAADVSAALATLVDSAPATLNTLNELAAALGDDANYAATTTAAIGLKAPIASPTFTGNIGMPNGSIDLAMMSANSVDSDQYVDGSVDDVHISGMAASKLTGDLPAISGANLTGVQPFPSGTVMVFHQTAAPTGWTKSTTHNDKALRVVSGDGGGNGGTHDLSSPPSLAHTHTGAAHTHTINHGHSNNLSAAAHTLSTAQMPSHSHGLNVARGQGSAVEYRVYWSSTSRISAGLTYNVNNQTQSTNSAGSGSSHSHGMSGSVTDHSGNSGSAGDGTTSSTTPTAFAPKYIDVIICAKD
jgi:hypothetical protein